MGVKLGTGFDSTVESGSTGGVKQINQSILNVTPSRVAVSNMPVSGGVDELFKKVSESFSKQADVQLKDWKEGVIKTAKEQGKLAGLEGKPEWKMDDSLASQAYNSMAQESFLAKNKMDAKLKISEYAAQHPNDPDAFFTSSKQYKDEIVSKMKENSRTAVLGAQLGNELEYEIQTSGYTIVKERNKLRAEQSKAADLDVFESIKSEGRKSAAGLVSHDPREQTNAMEKFGLLDQQLDLRLNALDQTGNRIYDPVAAQKMKIEFRQDFFIGAINDNFKNMTPATRSKVLTRTFEIDTPGGDKINVFDNIGSERYDKEVIKPLEAQMKQDERDYREKVKAQRESNKLYQEQNEFDAYAAIHAGKPLTVSDVIAGEKSGKYSPDGAKQLLKDIDKGVSADDDPDILVAIDQGISSGEDMSRAIKANRDKMKSETYVKQMAANTKMLQGQVDDIETYLKGRVTDKNIYDQISDESKIRSYEVVDTYRQLQKDVYGPDPKNPGRKILIKKGDSADVARVKVDTMIDQMLKEQVSRTPKYAEFDQDASGRIVSLNPKKSMDSLDAAYNNGSLSQEDYARELDDIATWAKRTRQVDPTVTKQ